MNAYVATKKWQVSTTGQVLRGVASIAFDHDMSKHRVPSDREARAADTKALARDSQTVWCRMKREHDAA